MTGFQTIIKKIYFKIRKNEKMKTPSKLRTQESIRVITINDNGECG